MGVYVALTNEGDAETKDLSHGSVPSLYETTERNHPLIDPNNHTNNNIMTCRWSYH